MDKAAFKLDTRYTLTWRDETRRSRPLNVYVFRLYDEFMIARETSGGGLLRRIGYADVERIVRVQEVPAAERLAVPAAVLEERDWRDRTTMEHYSSSPGLGK